jgi:hypothetical protein
MLGEIKKVQLLKTWKNEAYDFTPWLSENLERLGEEKYRKSHKGMCKCGPSF